MSAGSEDRLGNVQILRGGASRASWLVIFEAFIGGAVAMSREALGKVGCKRRSDGPAVRDLQTLILAVKICLAKALCFFD